MKLRFLFKENKYLVGLLVFFTLIWLALFFNFSSLWAQDSHWYASLVKNLGDKASYSLEGSTPHGQYPPGLPLLALPIYFLTGSAPIAGVITVFILSLASIILAFSIGKEYSKQVGYFTATILSFHNLFIFNSISFMTETPFMFFSILGLYGFMKSYDERKWIIPTMISLSISILIRYDGFFLAIPLLFYAYSRKKDFEDLFFSRKTLKGIGIFFVIILPWFIRNALVFGNPLYTSYSSSQAGFNFSASLSFLLLFFKTGYIFPLLVLLGLGVCMFKLKDKSLRTYLLWILVYLGLHAWWWARVLRFYSEILILLCLFASIGIQKLINIGAKDSSKKRVYLTVIIIGVLIIEQLFIFFSGSINHESTIYTLNRYDAIKQMSQYVNQNISSEERLVVPDVAVYGLYLEKENIYGYSEGINYLLSKNESILLVIDNLHSWITNPFYPVNGKITFSVPTNQGQNVPITLSPKLIWESSINKGDQYFNASIWKIEGYSIN